MNQDTVLETSTEQTSIEPKTIKSRTVTKKESEKVGLYFVKQNKEGLDFIPSGCKVLDCVLGGGWPLGRISNIIADKATGKTLLAIEAATNFLMNFPKGKVHYFEAEAAFDEKYAKALGLPADEVRFIREDLDDLTVESLFEDLLDICKSKPTQPILYVVDSLDALSDRAEQTRNISEGTYGATKAKTLSQLFRRLVAKLEDTKIHLMIISQIRDSIGAQYGPKQSRSGGRALDFYASQIIWLREKSKITKTHHGIERIIGINIEAECKKNKVGLPFRECSMAIYFGYGIDDIKASLQYLESVKLLDRATNIVGEISKVESRTTDKFREKPQSEIKEIREKLNKVVVEVWEEIESEFLPSQSKY